MESQHITHFVKNTYNLNINKYGQLAVQNTCKHHCSMLRKNKWKIRRELQLFEVVAICDHQNWNLNGQVLINNELYFDKVPQVRTCAQQETKRQRPHGARHTQSGLDLTFQTPAVSCLYTVKPLHRYTVTPLRRYTVTPLRPYALTPLRPYALTPLRRYAVTPLRPYTLTPFHIRINTLYK